MCKFFLKKKSINFFPLTCWCLSECGPLTSHTDPCTPGTGQCWWSGTASGERDSQSQRLVHPVALRASDLVDCLRGGGGEREREGERERTTSMSFWGPNTFLNKGEHPLNG